MALKVLSLLMDIVTDCDGVVEIPDYSPSFFISDLLRNDCEVLTVM